MKKTPSLYCRFYNDEKQNPFYEELDAHALDSSELSPTKCTGFEYDLPHEKVVYLHEAARTWFDERYWVKERMNGGENFDLRKNLLNNIDIVSQLERDNTPAELKAYLWHRFERMSKGTIDDFKEWYHSFYLSRPTNRQTLENFISELFNLGASPAVPDSSIDK